MDSFIQFLSCKKQQFQCIQDVQNCIQKPCVQSQPISMPVNLIENVEKKHQNISDPVSIRQ